MIVQLPTILYAVIAALSPLAFSATLVVLRSDRGRVNGALFTVGFVCAEAAVCMVGLLVDSVSISRNRGRPGVAAVLGLAAGVALLVAAVVIRRRPAPPPASAPGTGRTSRLLDRTGRLSLQQISLAAMFVVVACALVGVPALVYLTAGPSAPSRLQEMEEGVGAHRRQAAFYASLGFGAFLVVAATVDLLGR